MSRRLLNMNNLGVPPAPSPVENPMEIFKPKPIPVHSFIPNEPIILTKEQWEAVCSKTRDATIPYKVEITIIEKPEQKGDEVEEEEGVEENKDEETPYLPKKRRSKKN